MSLGRDLKILPSNRISIIPQSGRSSITGDFKQLLACTGEVVPISSAQEQNRMHERSLTNSRILSSDLQMALNFIHVKMHGSII